MEYDDTDRLPVGLEAYLSSSEEASDTALRLRAGMVGTSAQSGYDITDSQWHYDLAAAQGYDRCPIAGCDRRSAAKQSTVSRGKLQPS